MALNTSTSIVDYLKSKGQASDFGSRAKLAKGLGIQGYSGTAAQNKQLLSVVGSQSQQAPKQTPTQIDPAQGSTGSAPTPPKAAGPSLGALGAPSQEVDMKEYFQRNPDKEAAALKKFGPSKSPGETKLMMEATYKPEELKGMSPADRAGGYLDENFEQGKVFSQQGAQAMGLNPEQISALGPSGEALNQAAFNLAGTERPNNSSLRVLQDALKAKSGVSNQSIGESDLAKNLGFSNKGSAGYAILAQSLAQRSKEMDQKYQSYASVVGEVSGAMVDTYNVALDQYNLSKELYDEQKDDFIRANELTQAFEKQLDLLKRKSDLDKEAWDYQAEIRAKEKGGTIFVPGTANQPSGWQNPTTMEFTPSNPDVLSGGNKVAGSSQVYMGSKYNADGVDFAGKPGSPITASAGGVVEFAGNAGEWGNQVRVRVENKDGTTRVEQYSHLSGLNVTEGQTIPTGYNLGGMGNTGNVLTYDQATREWREPTEQELASGRGTHLDYTVYKEDGTTKYTVEEAANFAGIGENKEFSPLAKAVWDGMTDLSDLTPTQRGEIIPELNEAGYRNVVTNEIKQEISTILVQLNDIQKAWDAVDDNNKGQIQGRISWLTGAEEREPEVAEFNTTVGIIGQSIGRLFEKGRMSDEDRIFYLSRLPTLNYEPESVKSSLKAMKEVLNNKIQDTAFDNWNKILEGEETTGGNVQAEEMGQIKEFTGTTNSQAKKFLEENGQLATEANIEWLLSQ